MRSFGGNVTKQSTPTPPTPTSSETNLEELFPTLFGTLSQTTACEFANRFKSQGYPNERSIFNPNSSRDANESVKSLVDQNVCTDLEADFIIGILKAGSRTPVVSFAVSQNIPTPPVRTAGEMIQLEEEKQRIENEIINLENQLETEQNEDKRNNLTLHLRLARFELKDIGLRKDALENPPIFNWNFSRFQSGGMQETRDKMMQYFVNDHRRIILPEYSQPNNNKDKDQDQERLNEAHVNLPKSQTNKSSVPGGFNIIDLSNFHVNRRRSSMYLIRWDIQDDWVNHQLQQLFNGNLESLNSFISKEAEILQRMRDGYSSLFSKNLTADERREFQPVYQLFLYEFLLQLCHRVPSVQRTVAAANATPLEATFPLKETKDGQSTSSDTGAADLFILRGEHDAPIVLNNTQNNVEVVVELKPPYGPLYHTPNRAGIYQLTAEVEGLSQTISSFTEVDDDDDDDNYDDEDGDSSQTEPTINPVVKGVLTDLNSLALHVRVVHEEKVYHCVTHRIVEVEEYIKRLILICCCSITVEDMLESIRQFSVIDVSTCKDGKDGDDHGGNDYNNEDDDGKRGKSSQRKQTKKNSKNTQKNSKNKRSKLVHYYKDDDDVERDAYLLQKLLDHDARIRGIRVIRESDLLT